ncbi:hypothetical protein HRbin29_02268 [bacterium HR29]|jgi:copper(I)-binding protein|nr:hypothetical protein HRbin29_02268 [bacterium HR29]
MSRRFVLRPLGALLVVALVPLALAACGGGDSEGNGDESEATPTAAATYTLGDIVIVGPAARANPNPVSSVYMHIENRGSQADRLVGVACPLAGMAQIHEVVTEGGQSKMQEMAHGLEIPPGGHVELKPGGYHIMLMDLERPLQEGETIEVTLRFERAGEITIAVPVRSYDTESTDSGMGSGMGSGMNH